MSHPLHMMPVGTILMMGRSISSTPNKFLICDGSTVSRTVYSKLFEFIGTNYGAGDGSTTFNVPDFREAAPVGTGIRPDVSTHDTYDEGTFKDDQEQSFSYSETRSGRIHYASIRNQGGANGNAWVRSASWIDNAYLDEYPNAARAVIDQWYSDLSIIIPVNNSGARNGTTTRGKRLGVNFIIKAE